MESRTPTILLGTFTGTLATTTYFSYEAFQAGDFVTSGFAMFNAGLSFMAAGATFIDFSKMHNLSSTSSRH